MCYIVILVNHSTVYIVTTIEHPMCIIHPDGLHVFQIIGFVAYRCVARICLGVVNTTHTSCLHTFVLQTVVITPLMHFDYTHQNSSHHLDHYYSHSHMYLSYPHSINNISLLLHIASEQFVERSSGSPTVYSPSIE